MGIVAKFRLKKNPNSELVVATTHLLYNPRRQDVRLAQIQVLLSEIDRIAYRGINDRKITQYVPVILTGDFNLQPNTAPYCKLKVFGFRFVGHRFTFGLFRSAYLKRSTFLQHIEQPTGNAKRNLRTIFR